MRDRVLLCVDDEVSVLRSLKRFLRKENYQIVTATGGAEGLALLEKHPAQVVLSDQRMPGMMGTAFLRQVKEHYPETVRVMLSGYAEVHAILESINEGEIYRFLPKPWNEEELKVTLRQCFDRYDLIRQNRELIEQIHQKNETLRSLNETLEQLVEERTQSLHFAQEIVEKLPYPVLGVSQEGFAALANEAARRFFASTAFFLGADLDVFLPADLVEAVEQRLNGALPGPNDLTLSLNGRTVCSQIILLGESPTVRGCMLLMER